jgi:hypothetical protein
VDGVLKQLWRSMFNITARNHDGKDGHFMGGAVKDYKTVSLLVNIVMVDVMVVVLLQV